MSYDDFMKLPKEEALKKIQKSMDKFVAFGWLRIVGVNLKGETVYEPTEDFPWELTKEIK